MKSTIVALVWVFGALITSFCIKDQARKERDMKFEAAEDKTDRFSAKLEILWMWTTFSLLWPLYWLLAVVVYFRSWVEVTTGH